MLDWLGDYNTWSVLFLGDWGPLAIVLLVVLGVAVVALSWYDLRDMRAARRWTLVGLRASVYVVAVLLLLEPALELKHITKVKNKIAVLVDASLSQTLKVGDPEREGERRIDRAQAALGGPLKPLLTEPNEDHLFEVFTFGEAVEPSSVEAAGRAGALAVKDDHTRLLEAIEEVADTIGRRDLGGVMVLSDGIDSGLLGGRVPRGEPLDRETQVFLERLGAPIHTYATASGEGLKDISIESVRYDDFAFVRNTISIDAVLRVIGFEPARIPVTLKRDGQVLQTREVEVGPDKTSYTVTFQLVPQKIGKEIYSISVPEYAGEALVANNRKDIVLKVIRDKIRALQVVGRPTWDERFLRQLLKRNPNVDLISFFILRTNENAQTAPSDELSLIPFPTRELFEDELGSFDLVIFQNFNFRPYGMSRYLPRIAKYVRDGGGFVMVGGELSFASGAYGNTPLAGILPVELPPSGQPAALLDTTPFKPKLTDAGLRHPITQLAFDPAVNRDLWDRLPPLEGTNIVLGAKPQATVLAEHPSIKRSGKPMPVITVSDMGEGRVMSVTTDATWHWSFHNTGTGGTSRPYTSFWNSAIRWLIKDPELKLLQVKTDPTTIAPGGEVTVQISAAKPDYAPAEGVTGQLEVLFRPLGPLPDDPDADPTREEGVRTLPFTTDSRGRAEIRLIGSKPGAWRVRASASTDYGALTDEDVFLVALDSRELRSIEPRPELLAQLAQITGGTHHVLPDLDDSPKFKPARVKRVNRRKVIDVWDTLYVLGLICLLLSIEWSLRRSWGRL